MNSVLKTASFLAFVLLVTEVNAESAIDTASTLFEQAASSPTVPGISVAIADEHGVLWARGFGYSDLENRVPMSEKTRLRIGSVAKVLTAAGLMRLYEQGKIDLQADVRSLVPSWPVRHATINLAQLTSHTSGIRHYEGAEFMSNVVYESGEQGLTIFKNDELLFTPGSELSYSTYAWTLISVVMEKAERQAGGQRDFRQIMQQEVFTPLGMTGTVFDDGAPLIEHRHRPYTVSGDSLHNAPAVNASYKYAGGGFLSTPSDVVSFAVAHTDSGYLQADTLKMMMTPPQLDDGTKGRYGIGWAVGFDNYIQRASENMEENAEYINIMQSHPNSVMHGGGSVGGITMMILCLEHKRAVAVVKNVDGDQSVNVMQLALKTLDLFQQ